MALVKRADATEMARSAVVLDLGDLRRQADALRKQAQDDAEKILADAHADRDKLMRGAEERARKAGHEAGLETGLAEGRNAGRDEAIEQQSEQLAALTAGWDEALSCFESHRADLLEHTRRDLLAFVLEIASRVTKRLVEMDDTTALRQLEEAIALVIEPSRLIIETHPEDRAITEQALPALLARFATNADAQIVDSPELSRGSCVLRTEHGRIDATIELQIQRIAECLLGDDPQLRTEPIAPEPDAQQQGQQENEAQEPPAEDRSAA